MIVLRAARPRGVHVLLDLRIPAVAALQHGFAEEQREVLVDFPAIRLDALVRPLTARAHLAPGADVVRTALVLGAKDRLELRERELRDGIVSMHEDHVRVIEEVHVQAAGRDRYSGRRVSLGAPEGKGRFGADLLAENP